MNDRKCRVCGCTELDGCMDRTGFPCSWVADDLCSACLPAEAWAQVMPDEAIELAQQLGSAIEDWQQSMRQELTEDQARLAAFFFARGFMLAANDGPSLDELSPIDPQPRILLPGKDFIV